MRFSSLFARFRNFRGQESLKQKLVVLCAGFILGLTVISPASAHVGGTVSHLWTKHIKPLVAKLAYTKSQSDSRYALKNNLRDAGVLNSPSNPVHWTKLRGVPGSFVDGNLAWTELIGIPAGFTDGTDDVGLTSVQWLDILGIPAGFADNTDDVGLTSVSWLDILGIPAGFADGTDDINTDASSLTSGTLDPALLPPDGYNGLYPTEGEVTGMLGSYQQKYAQTVVVAKSGGDFTDPQAALASITDASAAKPYLLLIAPGVYDLSGGTFDMKEYVDVRGAGVNATVVTSAAGSWTGTVDLANHARLSDMTVRNTSESNGVAVNSLANDASASVRDVRGEAVATSGSYHVGLALTNSNADVAESYFSATSVSASGSTFNIGILANGAPTTATLRDVTSIASGGSDGNYGIDSETANLTVLRSTLLASGGTDDAVHVVNGSIALSEVYATASGGTLDRALALSGGGSAHARYSRLWGSNASIYNQAGNFMYIAHSMLTGTVTNVGGSLTCVGAYSNSYLALNTSCQ